MANGDLAFTTSVLVPVMLLVVTEIAGIVRELSLRDAISGPEVANPHIFERYFNKGLKNYLGIEHTNELGHFESLHAINCIILFAGIFMVGVALTPPARQFLTFGVVILLCILPYLEINEYADMRSEGVAIRSNIYHTIPSFFFGVLFAQLGVFAQESPDVVLISTIALVLAIPYAFFQIYFGERLASELRDTYRIER